MYRFANERPRQRGAALLVSALASFTFLMAPVVERRPESRDSPCGGDAVPGVPSPGAPGSAIRTTRCWATAAMTPSTTRSTSTSTSRRAPSSMRRPRSTPSPRKTCRRSTSISGVLRSMRSPSTASRRLDAGWRRADDHSRATAARRGAFPDGSALSRHAGDRRRRPVRARLVDDRPIGLHGRRAGGSDVWYPVNGHPRDKATYTLAITVPEPYEVVSNGLLDSVARSTGPRATPRRSPTPGRTRSRRRVIS